MATSASPKEAGDDSRAGNVGKALAAHTVHHAYSKPAYLLFRELLCRLVEEKSMNEKHIDGAMPSEETPLLQHVPVADQRRRYPHQSLRRWCTIALTAIPLLILVVALVYVLITGDSDVFGDSIVEGSTITTQSRLGVPHSSWPESEGLSYKKLKKILKNTPSGEKAREWSQYYTAGPHLCGKNLSQAEWTRDLWSEFGVPKTEIVSYDMYLNYPVFHSLALLKDGEVTFQATLEEDVLSEDPTTSLPDRVPTFHGYSASGDVTAPIVFCNYGTFADFEDLQEAGIELEGKIALIKYGGIFRGLKAKRASELGLIGAILYTDPGDDGEFTEGNGYEVYPNGPARNPSSVQRGSMAFISLAPGDPTTPGYPSKAGAQRQSPDGLKPDIPSLPISYAEALPLLRALNGNGPNASSFPSSWHTGGLGYKGIDYNIGPTPDEVTVHLVNEQEYVTTPAWNVIGIINGSIPDEVIVMGNHRDAWIAGGAADPNSGSASMNEVIRSFGEALKQGWKPQRTIVFASWDGEEYGLLGSTEWVEEFLPWLSEASIAYINVDIGANGPHFKTSAAPVLNKLLYEITSQVPSPNQTVEGQTIGDVWSGEISTIGSGSDFTAFQDFAGVSSVDVGFNAGLKEPAYHYHSNYDSFTWMDEYGDPGFKYHRAIAQILGLLAAKLMEEPVVAFNASDYGLALQKYADGTKGLAAESEIDQSRVKNMLKPLEKAIKSFQRASSTFDEYAAKLALAAESLSESSDLEASKKKSKLFAKVRSVNTKYKLLERQFLHAQGLDSRSWFKHVVFAPGLWTGYAGAVFPGLVEAIDAKNETAVEKWVEIIAGNVDSATELLAL